MVGGDVSGYPKEPGRERQPSALIPRKGSQGAKEHLLGEVLRLGPDAEAEVPVDGIDVPLVDPREGLR